MHDDWEVQDFTPSSLEWDYGKAQKNRRKHGIDFEDAAKVFAGPVIARLEIEDAEERWICVGGFDGRQIVVVFTERTEDATSVCRIISARRAEKRERDAYYQILYR